MSSSVKETNKPNHRTPKEFSGDLLPDLFSVRLAFATLI